MTGTVEGQLSDFEPFTVIPTRASTAKDRPNAENELSRAKRLDDVIVGPQLEPDNPINLVGSGRKDQDHDLTSTGIRFHGATEVETRHLRQHQVENNQGRRIVFYCTQRGQPIRLYVDGKTCCLEMWP